MTPTYLLTSITRFEICCSITNKQMYLHMPHSKIFFHVKKYSNDATRIFLKYFICDKEYFTKDSSKFTCSCSYPHSHAHKLMPWLIPQSTNQSLFSSNLEANCSKLLNLLVIQPKCIMRIM